MYWKDSHRALYNADCRAMVDLPDESVQMVVTSPPYWGLRKYAGLPDDSKERREMAIKMFRGDRLR